MKTKYLFIAAIGVVTLASCADDVFVGDNSPNAVEQEATNTEGMINFGFEFPNMTRADIYGGAAAKLLGNAFYVTGTKGTEAAKSPTPTLVFDNYLVHYTANTAGTTESNTANWEYVGVTPGSTPYEDWVKTGSYSSQTIKYWDYSTAQYDFLAFSTGTFKAVKDKAIAEVGTNEINVTAMLYGTSLENSAVAYTFGIPSIDALKQAYITDITEVANANYGKEVTLRFKNLGAKVRVALYETVPGYSVKDVKFYTVDGTNSDLATTTTGYKVDNATLISADASGLPTKGTIAVYFPHVGNDNSSAKDYDKAATTVTPVTTSSVKTQNFGPLTNQLVVKADAEDETSGTSASKIYLGRTLPTASFAGEKNANFYQMVFPVSNSSALTLRVDYTLVSTDASKEEIHVYGAKAVVPSTYTVWLPNYAYTYIFKISDNTNGWTTNTGTLNENNQGLYPITFDAVVAEATDADGEQTTVTTVATPTITTYQQGHTNATDEYKKGEKALYVQVMDNSTTSPVLVGTSPSTMPLLNDTDPITASLLFSVETTGTTDISEATVMDALQKRTNALSEDNVNGRNGIKLTKNNNIDNTVTTIENGVDNNPIKKIGGADITAGQVAKITINSLTAGTYAYVYDYGNATKTTVTEYQPISVTNGSAIGTSGSNFASITTENLNTITDVTLENEAVSTDYIYFSKTTNGTGTTTYSYISTTGKSKLPAGLIKVEKSDTKLAKNLAYSTNAVPDTFYFDTYITNDGKYAVKVIKVID